MAMFAKRVNQEEVNERVKAEEAKLDQLQREADQLGNSIAKQTKRLEREAAKPEAGGQKPTVSN